MKKVTKKKASPNAKALQHANSHARFMKKKSKKTRLVDDTSTQKKKPSKKSIKAKFNEKKYKKAHKKVFGM